ncbi:chromosome segregation protein SMC [Candidatus Pacearchaeota archaeon]|nr:chromosome segregation protein SMC [Candidatus Pacearchaeota archaeon]
MPHIKKLVCDNFKSFASKTEIPFSKEMNIVVGANGAGKSNIVDSICFVLGRLSMKSIRAEKSSSLIFSGTKTRKPADKASVKLIFDNEDRGFPIEQKEVAIERIVKSNGESTYKINNETKTRYEILELLATAGIDPHGFNIILQGEIMDLVKMGGEDRRKIIEDVAGISVYEARKGKSLKELEKTDEKLKEINAILRERTTYLNNLDKERQQALKFKNAEMIIKRCKATLIHKNIELKEKENEKENVLIEKNEISRSRKKESMELEQKDINFLETEINDISAHIQSSSGIEQETLHEEITQLKSNLAALEVRKENLANRIDEIKRRRNELEKNIEISEKEIEELKKKSPILAKKQQELRRKKEEFSKIEETRKRMYELQAEISALKERIKEKLKQKDRIKNESAHIVRQIEEISRELSESSLESCKAKISVLNEKYREYAQNLNLLNQEKTNFEKESSVHNAEIRRLEKIRQHVSEIDICPLCHSKITEKHIAHVKSDADKKIIESKNKIALINNSFVEIERKKGKIERDILELRENLEKKEHDLLNLRSIEEKKTYLKKLMVDEKELENAIEELKKKRVRNERDIQEFDIIEEKYDRTILELEEISAMSEGNIDTTLMYKERELENIKNIIKRSLKDEQVLDGEINDMLEEIKSNARQLIIKEAEDKKLTEKFQKLFDKRNSIQKQIHEKNTKFLHLQHELRAIENVINEQKINKARTDAELSSLKIEFSEFEGIELLKLGKEAIEEKLSRTKEALGGIGPVNMRALEVYDAVKQEYEDVKEKVEKLEQEKVHVLSIIEEIDKKKKKVFVRTLDDLNEIFSRNFMQLSTKGAAFLELENKEDPFAGALNITIKVGKGKYFDVHSLSGGEKTLVALSLIFAVQEYKPYHFYLFDEIDAALDKRNSEKLAGLMKKYMKSGQYIIVSHNDAIITESSLLYGVSMQDGISKVLTLKV